MDTINGVAVPEFMRTPELQGKLEALLKKIKNMYLYDARDNLIYEGVDRSQAEGIVDKLIEETATFMIKSGMKSVLIPMSGGADSTLVAALLRMARDEYDLSYKIIGVTLPHELQADADHYNDLGLWAGRFYCDEVTTVELKETAAFLDDHLFNPCLRFESGKTFGELATELCPDYTAKQLRIDRGNTTARLRMIFSYGWATRFGGAQPSTDNLSELLMGFWTLCGDEGTFKLIQKILKGVEQPLIMDVLEIPPIYIVQKPTDGLGVSDGDVAQLYGELYTGAETYFDVDCVVIRHFAGVKFPDSRNPAVFGLHHPVIKQFLRTGFKRHPFVIERETLGLTDIGSNNPERNT